MTLSSYYHQIGIMDRFQCLWFKSYNSGMLCMSFYFLMVVYKRQYCSLYFYPEQYILDTAKFSLPDKMRTLLYFKISVSRLVLLNYSIIFALTCLVNNLIYRQVKRPGVTSLGLLDFSWWYLTVLRKLEKSSNTYRQFPWITITGGDQITNLNFFAPSRPFRLRPQRIIACKHDNSWRDPTYHDNVYSTTTK